MLDSVVQEIDIPTGLVLFQWDSLDHVPLSSSYAESPAVASAPYDYFHVNSIQQDTDGNLIVSSRDTFAAYKIDHNTGQVMWILGGKRSSFKMGRGARFAFQHDVRVHGKDDNTVTLFDNGGGPPRVHRWTRGLTLALNFRRHARDGDRPGRTLAAARLELRGQRPGPARRRSLRRLGPAAVLQRVQSRGRIVFDGHFVDANANYRAYKFPWTGRPQRPAVGRGQRTPAHDGRVGKLERGHRDQALARVRRQQAELDGALRTVGIRGFETRILIRRDRYVQVQALDGKGRPLESSPRVRAR